MNSGSTCIFVDGSGGCPKGFQGPTGGWTTCLSVEGTGGRPLGFQGPRTMGWDGQCD